MKYLVSIENSQYFQWQINLLIESFKKHNLQNDLIIAVAHKNDEIASHCQNFIDHPNKFAHNNTNFINPYLNKAFSAFLASEAGLLGNEFVIIEPDMVLVKPLDSIKENIAFSTNSMFTQELFVQSGYSHVMKDLKQWIYLGGVIQFNSVNSQFLKNAFLLGQTYEHECKNKKLKYLDKASWMGAFFKYSNTYSIKQLKNCEGSLLGHSLDNLNFIHYTNGMPPVFNKRMYFFDPQIGFCLQGKDPLQLLKENSVTPEVDYIRDLILSIEK